MASMNATDHFYYQDGEEIPQEWNPVFVVFAFAIAFVSSYMAVHLLDHDLWRTDEEKEKALIRHPRSVAAFALGFGTVWCMHFVGMAAVTLDHTPICFDWFKTLGSLAASIIFMFIAVMVASTDIFATQDRVQVLKEVVLERRNGNTRRSSRDRKQRKRQRMREIFSVIAFQQLHPLIIAACVSATGALVMHYTGMMAQRGPFRKEWNLSIIMTSVITAVLVCFAGFWIIFRLRWKVKDLWPRYLSAGIIATGVCCLHFLGMLGATYYADSTVEETCARTTETSLKSPNAWNSHQIVVVAIAILVPTIGVYVENMINQELLLVYGKHKDRAFNGLLKQSNSSKTSTRISKDQGEGSEGVVFSIAPEESAEIQEDGIFEELAMELKNRLTRNSSDNICIDMGNTEESTKGDSI